MPNQGAPMIKILPTGTSAVLKYGLKPTRTNKSRGRLGDGSKECSFEFATVELDAIWKTIDEGSAVTLSKDDFLKEMGE